MKDQITILVHKQLIGDITPDEEQLLDQLLDESGQAVSDDIATVWDAAGHYSPSVSFDSNAAFASMMTRVSDAEATTSDVSVVESKEEKTAKVVPMFTIAKVARWAAIFVFGIASYTMVQNMLPQTISGGATGSFAMLDDGSSVWLSPNTKLDVKSAFFGERRVALEGKAFFDVAKDADSPFTVDTDDVDVTVLGTSFTIDSDTDVVAVASGKVKIATAHDEITVTKGDKVKLTGGKLNTSVATSDDFLWTNPTLTFDNAPLDRVLKELSVHFEIDIKYRGKRDLSICPFTATNLSEASLDDVLAVLRATYSMEIDRTTEQPSIILSKVRCR